MDTCVMCLRRVERAENWIKCHLWSGFAIFNWRCFEEYRSESEQQLKMLCGRQTATAEPKEVINRRQCERGGKEKVSCL